MRAALLSLTTVLLAGPAFAEGNDRLFQPPTTQTVQQTLTGVVTSATTNAPLSGVSVAIKGTSRGSATDDNGRYTISATSGETLVFSSLGYVSQEVAVEKQTGIDIQLREEAASLDEVVVVGYGTQRKSDLTGSVGVLSAEELLQAPVNNALQGMKGRVAGVNVFLNSGSPSGSPRIL